MARRVFAYGERVLQQPASGANRTWFTTHHHDDDTGLTYAGARHYDPMIGRFMGVDPATMDPADQFTFNRYAYGNNNPYKFVDPDARVVDLIADIGFIAYSAYVLITEPSLINATALGADVVGAVVPFATGLGAGVRAANTGVEAARAADKTAEVARGATGIPKGLGNIGSHSVIDAGEALGAGQKWLGAGYTEIASGVLGQRMACDSSG